MSTVEERFQAAVNVIKGLPKNGPYQPSTTMMLEFYSLYKQATKGPCYEKKPPFWEVYARAKWDAWQKKRNLTQQQAMQQYVDSLQKIIETMSYTENVQNFIGSLSDLENINLDELDKVMPGMKELAESHPNSPFNTRQNSPQHMAMTNGDQDQNGFDLTSAASGDSEELASSILNSGSTTMKTASEGISGKHHLTDDKTLKPDCTQALTTSSVVSHYPDQSDRTTQSDDEYADPFDMQNDFTESIVLHTELLRQVQSTVARMNSEIHLINQRLSTFENILMMISRQQNSTSRRNSASMLSYPRRYGRWWPFASISPQWFIILLLWPFVAKRFLRILPSSRYE